MANLFYVTTVSITGDEKFPYYKGTRKKDRQKSSLDWNEIFELLNKIRDEIRDHMPYKVVEVDGAEADDVIASLVRDQAMRNIRLQNNMQPAKKVLILSGDKDFVQLQRYKFVNQYNPIQKKFMNGIDPKVYLLEHIIKGDRGDGIPNFLSDDDTFVSEKRQRPLSKVKLARWIDMSPKSSVMRKLCRTTNAIVNSLTLHVSQIRFILIS